MVSEPLRETHEEARNQAKDIDKYAACSSAGDFEFDVIALEREATA